MAESSFVQMVRALKERELAWTPPEDLFFLLHHLRALHQSYEVHLARTRIEVALCRRAHGRAN